MFLRGEEGGRAYGCSVGIEIWAVIALITVLSVYLLPYLVGRREMAWRSNVQDRYSAELRVLATGTAAVERDDTCASSGHAELFRRRPEVRAMNRPAVRNVRALRTERELDHARQVHAQGRERRRVAASHRGIVASVLLGVSLGAWVLGLVTALPWWPALLPTALLGTSMVAGHRAALASAAADRRERRRIAELEQTLVTLTGRRSSASVVGAPRSVVDGAHSASSGAVGASAASPAVSAVSAESVESAGDSGAQDPFIERLAREDAQRPAASSASSPREAVGAAQAEPAVSAETAAGSPAEATGTGTAAARPSQTVDSEEERLARLDADLDDETAAAVAAEREATRRASVYVPSRHAGRVTRDMGVREAVSRDGDEESSPRTKDFVASLSASASRGLSGWGKLFAEATAIEQEAQERAAAAPSLQVAAEPARRTAESAPRATFESARPVGRPQAPATAAPAEAGGAVKEEMTTSTPPQGWRPVHVPAPTYTLAARAPRRSYADPVVDPGTCAPVPARPQSARAYVPAPVEDEEELFHPIDLDAILEGRRAAGE